jgi:hypothetical protein
MRYALLVLSLCSIVEAAEADPKPTWPVRALTFTIKDKAGWTPATAKVPKGAEVQLTLVNHSDAPACFEIASKKAGKFVKDPICVDTGETRRETFFANVDAGSYPIRNRWEQQQAGTFVVE